MESQKDKKIVLFKRSSKKEKGRFLPKILQKGIDFKHLMFTDESRFDLRDIQEIG